MTVLQMLVHTSWANAFGWAIFHSLWQGAIAALIPAVTIWATRSPRVRYAAASLAMFAMFIGFCATFVLSMHTGPVSPVIVAAQIAQAPSGITGHTRISVPARLSNALPWLTPFWIAGMFVFHLRSLAGWMTARRLRMTGACTVPVAWQQRLDDLRNRLRITKPVVLLETALAHSPGVIGWLRPVILLPIGMMAGMPASQVEAILVHELGHIRRHDYLAGLFQMIVEGFLFYHPAVWWISHVVRTERENCCDDLAVEVNGNAHEYATALTLLAANHFDASQPVMAATGGPLMKRISRLLYPKHNTRSFLTPAISAGILGTIIALALPGWQSPAPDAFSRWLNQDVVYIITAQERTAFQSLATNEERQQFIEQFWLRRDPTPGTIQNEYQEEHYRRIAYTNDRFGSASGLPGWKTDRGRIYIMFGPPDELDSHPNGSAAGAAPYDEWLYRFIEGIGTNVRIMFVDQNQDGEYHMTMDPNPGPGRRMTNPRQQ
jgi:GWxTD domain-containing protein